MPVQVMHDPSSSFQRLIVGVDDENWKNESSELQDNHRDGEKQKSSKRKSSSKRRKPKKQQQPQRTKKEVRFSHNLCEYHETISCYDMPEHEKQRAYYQRDELQEIMNHAFLCVDKIIEDEASEICRKKRVCARGLEWLVEKRKAEMQGFPHTDMARTIPLALLQAMKAAATTTVQDIAETAQRWNQESKDEARQRGKKDAKAVTKLQRKELKESTLSSTTQSLSTNSWSTSTSRTRSMTSYSQGQSMSSLSRSTISSLSGGF